MYASPGCLNNARDFPRSDLTCLGLVHGRHSGWKQRADSQIRRPVLSSNLKIEEMRVGIDVEELWNQGNIVISSRGGKTIVPNNAGASPMHCLVKDSTLGII